VNKEIGIYLLWGCAADRRFQKTFDWARLSYWKRIQLRQTEHWRMRQQKEAFDAEQNWAVVAPLEPGKKNTPTPTHTPSTRYEEKSPTFNPNHSTSPTFMYKMLRFHDFHHNSFKISPLVAQGHLSAPLHPQPI
jgi:hypothetical protein